MALVSTNANLASNLSSLHPPVIGANNSSTDLCCGQNRAITYVIFLHIFFKSLKQLIEQVEMAWHIDLIRTSRPALFNNLGGQPFTNFLIEATICSNYSLVDLPRAVEKPKYFSTSAYVGISVP